METSLDDFLDGYDEYEALREPRVTVPEADVSDGEFATSHGDPVGWDDAEEDEPRLFGAGSEEDADGPPRGKGSAGGLRAPFLRGPVPVSWLCRAGDISGSALATGLAAWHLAGLKRSESDLRLTSKAVAKFGVTVPSTKHRAVKALEQAGLIRVTTANGKNPVVSIVRRPEDGPVPCYGSQSMPSRFVKRGRKTPARSYRDSPYRSARA